MRPRQLTLFLILLTLSGPLYGYSSPNLPVDDPVYRDIDKLIAAGLVKDVIYGQRPWSRREIARMIFVSSERRKNSPEEEEAKPVWRYVDQILARLKEEFHEELVDSGRLEGERKSSRIHPVEKADFDYTLLDSPFRTVPRDNGLADTDAQINPLTAYRGGRHYVDGSTLGLETTHTAKLSKYLSLYARPRLETSVPNTGAAEVNLLPQNLYAKTAYERFALQAGRDSLIWGQGEHGGLLLSDNARPLDMIKLGTDSPLSLPWILKYAGPTGFQIFFAAMGPERNDYPNAILSGYKLTLKPVAFFEIAVNHVVMMGGDGANDPGFWEALGEFTGAKGTFTGNKRQDAFTNRLFSIEGRWTLPFFRNSVFYAEVGFDDTYSTLKVLFEDNAMYLAGIYIPRLDASGRLDLRMEYKHIPAGAYRHFQYTGGYTLNQRLLGDDLGPDGDGIYGSGTLDLPQGYRASCLAGYEIRDSDLWEPVGTVGNMTDIRSTVNNPAEHRLRIQGGLGKTLSSRLGVRGTAGYETVRNFGFLPNGRRDSFLLSLQLMLSP